MPNGFRILDRATITKLEDLNIDRLRFTYRAEGSESTLKYELALFPGRNLLQVAQQVATARARVGIYERSFNVRGQFLATAGLMKKGDFRRRLERIRSEPANYANDLVMQQNIGLTEGEMEAFRKALAEDAERSGRIWARSALADARRFDFYQAMSIYQ